jgi:hypothetical protein
MADGHPTVTTDGGVTIGGQVLGVNGGDAGC